MVHNAFDSVQIVKECSSKIESIAVWGGKLFLGCMDGSLRVYQPPPQGPDDEDAASTAARSEPQNPKIYTLRNTMIGFAKKAVAAMDVVQSRKLLISLSDGVTVHSLPDLDAVAYLSKTKGASSYTLDERRAMLAVAKLRRIFVYKLDGAHDFVELKELTAPDAVKSMAWCGDSLCLGIRREYIIMNITTGTTSEMFPCGRTAAPLAVSLPNGEVLLGKDNIGVFVDQNGKMKQQGAISWSEAPAAAVISKPYAVARLVRFLEVRSLREPFGLVQMVPLRDIQLLLSTDEGIWAASETSVFHLQQVSIGVQVVQLAASGNFDEALALCKMLPPEDSALRYAKENSIHIRYGRFLFNQGQYADALQHFGASSLPLRAILSMFSPITLPNTAGNFEDDNGSDSLSSQAGMSMSQANSDLLDDTALPDQDEKVPMDAKQRAIALTALTSFLVARRGAVVDKAEAEATEAAVAAMVEVVQAKRGTNVKRPKSAEKSPSSIAGKFPSRELATLLDTALVQAYLLTDQSPSALQLLKGPNYCDVTACEYMMKKGGHYVELIELYKCNQMHREALQLLNRVVSQSDTLEAPPHWDQQLGVEALLEYMKPLGGQDAELILEHSKWLLKNSPDQAVMLFASMDPPIVPNTIILHLKEHAPSLQSMYLEQMLKNDAKSLSSDLQNELVQLYLSQVLEERAELQALGKWEEREYTETRRKLLSALDSGATYNAEIVLKRLPTDGLYEERALLLGRMKQHQLALTLYAHKLHEPELALEYCDRIYSSRESRSSNKSLPPTGRSILQGSAEQAVTNIYLTLLEVYLKPRAAIKEFDRSIASLAVSRGRTSHKLGTVHKVKGHVARKIAQIEGADNQRQNLSSTDSAADSARSDNDEAPEVGRSVKEVMLKEALELLTRRWDRMDGALALQMLPPDTKLKDLLPFLAPLLQKSGEVHRNASVIKSLRRGENVQVREELLQCRKRVVKITSDRTCSICRKRLGTSVFAVYPNGTLVHFVCYRDQNAKISLPTTV